MKKQTITILTALLLLTSSIVWGADFQKGLAAYKKGDFAAALAEWKPLAEQGDADAQFFLGVMYQTEQGVIQDYKTAVKWYTLAAQQGDASAQLALGLMYALGNGVPKNNVFAYMWLNIAASSGGSKNAPKAREMVAKNMTAADISKAQELARECIRKQYKGCTE